MPKTIPDMDRIIKLLRARADSAYRLRNSLVDEKGEDDPHTIEVDAEWLEREHTLALLTDSEFFEKIWSIYIKEEETND